MASRGAWKLVHLVLLFAGCGFGYDVVYRRIFAGLGLTVTGEAELYQNFSSVRCASLCSIRLSCFSWAWEPSSWECKVYTSLSSTSARTTAPASTLTYGVIDGYFFENFPSPVAMSWAEAKSACESRGAFLAMPASQEQTKLLMQWVGYNYAWVGIWRYSAAATWFDVFDNAVAGLYWAPAEPEDPYEWGSYRVPSGGLVTTPTTQRTYIPLCKTLP